MKKDKYNLTGESTDLNIKSFDIALCLMYITIGFILGLLFSLL